MTENGYTEKEIEKVTEEVNEINEQPQADNSEEDQAQEEPKQPDFSIEQLVNGIGGFVNDTARRVNDVFNSPETVQKAEEIKKQTGKTADGIVDGIARGAAVIGGVLESAFGSLKKGIEDILKTPETEQETETQEPEADETVCPWCGQKLPADQCPAEPESADAAEKAAEGTSEDASEDNAEETNG